MILKYIYTGEVDLSRKSGASGELLLEKLNNHVQTLLFEKQSTWIQQNFVSVFHTVFKLDSCKKSQEHCLKSICADPQLFVTSKGFPDDLLKRDAVAWDYLIKWGIEQTLGLGSSNSNRAKWNDINYKELKKTLSQFPADVFDRTVIPHHIYEDVAEFYYKKNLTKTMTLPPRTAGKIQIESRLINLKLANKIANWIERDTKKKYKFELLYRSSRDRISSNAFRAKCNNQGPCIVLVKQPSTTKIYGGYNPLTFTHSSDGRWYSTNESFIFSFENSEDVENMKISRINNYYSNYAIHEQNNIGFNFGNTFYMNGQCVYLSYSLYYDRNVVNSSLSISFIPEEIEVLKVFAFP